MKCSKCGNEIQDEAKFCNICGERLNTESSNPNINLNKDNADVKAEVVKPPKKKNKTFIAVIGVVVVLIMGVALASMSGESEDVTRVKEGHFLDYSEDDGYTDIGTAFENYFSDTSWESFTSEEGMDIVQFDGTCMYYDKETNCSIQFELYDDGGFSIYAMEFNGVPQNRLMIDAVVEDAMQESWGNDMND